jgi:hypothetical protein
MKNIYVQENCENPSTKQLDRFEWAGLTDESEVGFAVRNGLRGMLVEHQP